VTRPLLGKSIVITRPRAQAREFAARLEALGAEVIQSPTIRIRPVEDAEPLREAARDVGRFDWVVFTSANGVAYFWTALREVGRDSRALAGVSLCAIGPATAAALESEGVRPHLVPERYVAESVLEALGAGSGLQGARILLPRAEIARAVLPDELRAAGAEVVEVAAYRTVPDTGAAELLRARLRTGTVDLITFTSGSAVQNFEALMGKKIGPVKIASIGPITSAAARELGLPVHIEATEHTVPGLIRSILAYYESAEHAGL
jgi:uroporphyrinogen III methyltransferase / synthase